MTTSDTRADSEAELAVLAAMMRSAQAVEECVELVRPDDFSSPVNRDIFRSLVAMRAAGEPVDRLTLRAWMARDHIRVELGYLDHIRQVQVAGEAATAHARMVADQALRRNMARASARLAELAADQTVTSREVIFRAQVYMDGLADSAVSGRRRSLSIEEFLALDGVQTTPVIPGLLDHQDRVVVVAAEGAGKTVLAHQVAFCLAAGLHPFTRNTIAPGKVLIIDFENPMGMLQRRLRALLDIACKSPGWAEGEVRLYAEPGGVDLQDARDAFDLADVIRQDKPDLIVGGPVYKMFSESENDAPAHAAVTEFFDAMRTRYGCAIWLETHAPIQTHKGQRNLRPVGSGRWTRWPDFGIALEPTKEGMLRFGRFKEGDREEGRMWPDEIFRNPGFRPCWPWLARYPDGTLNDRLG